MVVRKGFLQLRITLGRQEEFPERRFTRTRVGRVAVLLVFLFCTNLFSAGMESAAHAEDADHVASSHGSGHSCPDFTDLGDGCSPACDCSCCPGHLFIALYTLPTPTGVPLRVARRQSVFPDTIRSEDVTARIFRPPLS